MEKYNGSLIRQFPSLITGNAASGVNVSVCGVNTSNLVTIYGVDDTNSTPIANPITTDSKGFYSFYVPDGRYTLRFSNGFPALEINMIDAVAWATIIEDVGGILYEAQTKKDGPFTVGSLTGGVIPLTNINYTPGTGLQIWVMADGDKLTYLDDYTESGPQSVTLTASALAALDPATEIEVWTNSIVPYSNPSAGSSADTKTYSSFAAMVAGDNSGFEKVETKHYYADWTAAAATPKGAASYVRTTETGTPGDTDGGSYFVATDGFKFVLDYDDRVFISQFGAKVANDTFDNRAAIQACLDFCTTSGANFVVDPVEQTWDPSLNGGSGGYINRYFGIGSFHPDYVDGYCLFVGEPRNFFIFGNTSRLSSIRYYGSTPGKCLLRLGAIYGLSLIHI